MTYIATGGIYWPSRRLRPEKISPNIVPFSRSGGKTFAGQERVARTDSGFWMIGFAGVALTSVRSRRSWQAVASTLSGRSGLVIVPVWSMDSAPWPEGTREGIVLTTHSDGTTFSDGTRYSQDGISVEVVNAVAIGDRVATLRIVGGVDGLDGVRWSYGHALYQCGAARAIGENEWTMQISPAIRAPISAGQKVQVSRPTCLCRLASDREMDLSLTAGNFDKPDVMFTEATDYWNDLAIGEA